MRESIYFEKTSPPVLLIINEIYGIEISIAKEERTKTWLSVLGGDGYWKRCVPGSIQTHAKADTLKFS
jgi:hypothetical protein